MSLGWSIRITGPLVETSKVTFDPPWSCIVVAVVVAVNTGQASLPARTWLPVQLTTEPFGFWIEMPGMVATSNWPPADGWASSRICSTV